MDREREGGVERYTGSEREREKRENQTRLNRSRGAVAPLSSGCPLCESVLHLG